MLSIELIELILLSVQPKLDVGYFYLERLFSFLLDDLDKVGPCLANYFLDPLERQAECPSVEEQVLHILGT
jgi:hypothetical protein